MECLAASSFYGLVFVPAYCIVSKFKGTQIFYVYVLKTVNIKKFE